MSLKKFNILALGLLMLVLSSCAKANKYSDSELKKFLSVNAQVYELQKVAKQGFDTATKEEEKARIEQGFVAEAQAVVKKNGFSIEKYNEMVLALKNDLNTQKQVSVIYGSEQAEVDLTVK